MGLWPYEATWLIFCLRFHSGVFMSYNNQIIIDIDSETKQDLQKMADKRSVTLSELILGLISDGAILERQRRKQVH